VPLVVVVSFIVASVVVALVVVALVVVVVRLAIKVKKGGIINNTSS